MSADDWLGSLGTHGRNRWNPPNSVSPLQEITIVGVRVIMDDNANMIRLSFTSFFLILQVK